MDQRQIVRLIAVGRVALGVTALVAPRRLGALAFGAPRAAGALVMATRMLGARDLVLGLGALRALDQDIDAPTWARAGAAADAADAAAALLSLGRIPARHAVPTVAVAAGSAIASFRAAPRLG